MAYASASSASAGEPSVTASTIMAQAGGSHILRVDGYSHTKGFGNGKSIASEKFVVGGHRWYLQYYPDGDSADSSDWISVFLRLDQTNYVDEVKANFTISLLDQDGNPVPSYSKTGKLCRFTGSGTNSTWGYGKFIKRSNLEGSAYLKDDVFSFKCDVSAAAKEMIAKAIPVPAVRRSV